MDANLLKQYATVQDLIKDIPVWKALSLSDRIKTVKAFEQKAKMGQSVKQPILIINESYIGPESMQQPNTIYQGAPGQLHPVSTTTLQGPLTNPIPAATHKLVDAAISEIAKPVQSFSMNIKLNEMQQAAVEKARKGESFCLTGAAGTGKTTAMREVIRALMDTGFEPEEIGIGAFTRVATGNIRKAIERDEELGNLLGHRIRTVHKHLEFMPFFWDDLETGKKKMEFRPTRTADNPLDIKLFGLEEASMLDIPLWLKFYDAMREGTILIFIGDLNQLPPVFGKSIFNYALSQLPIIELTEVYRQALDSGIIQNAHRVLDGKIPVANKDCQIVAGNPAKRTGQLKMAMALGRPDGFFHKLFQSKEYQPETDIILSPWNKHPMGTIEMNNWIAQFLGDERKARVYEVIAGMRKLYLAEGDQVFLDKKLGSIIKISSNGDYKGRLPQAASEDLLRFGTYRIAAGNHTDEEDFDTSIYENINADDIPDEDKKNQASHIIYIKLQDDEDSADLIELRTAGDLSEASFSLGYCLTVHKAQGGEWRKVFLLMHEDHASKGNFISRELLYTAITRAREKLVIIAKEVTLEKAVKNQIIKGRTIEEKIAFINSGAQNVGQYPVVKALPEGQKADWIVQKKEEKEKERVRIASIPKPPVRIPFTDFSKYVPEHIADMARDSLVECWDRAKLIYGPTIGDYPRMTFDCQRSGILGLANAAGHYIKLNPVYMAYGAHNEECLNEMVKITIPHELAHIIAGRYGHARGHDAGWIMTMKLLSQNPSATYTGDALPKWNRETMDMIKGWTGSDVVIEDGVLSVEEEA